MLSSIYISFYYILPYLDYFNFSILDTKWITRSFKGIRKKDILHHSGAIASAILGTGNLDTRSSLKTSEINSHIIFSTFIFFLCQNVAKTTILKCGSKCL